jgi:hypothetical protein
MMGGFLHHLRVFSPHHNHCILPAAFIVPRHIPTPTSPTADSLLNSPHHHSLAAIQPHLMAGLLGTNNELAKLARRLPTLCLILSHWGIWVSPYFKFTVPSLVTLSTTQCEFATHFDHTIRYVTHLRSLQENIETRGQPWQRWRGWEKWWGSV